jgi:hypothetical protein
MHMSGVTTPVTEDEARRIGEFIQARVLPGLDLKARVRLDGTATAEPDGGKVHQGSSSWKNYGATHEWLRMFAAFCATCKGFEVC